jgi:YfiH family protein
MTHAASKTPDQRLVRTTVDGVTSWVARQYGALVAFSERGGGVSEPPFASLNLAAHVGDDPAAVARNRWAWLGSLGLTEYAGRLTMADQVHGERIALVTLAEAGSGADPLGGLAPVAATDALVTRVPGLPLALCFADCVPVALVAPGPVVAVVHAGWRGALASLPGKAASALASEAGCSAGEVVAFVGAHIRACHYQVGDAIMSQFVNTFGTVAQAHSGGLDLDAVVTASLMSAGVASCNIARLGICTAEAGDHFFSYRNSAGVTGRHAALACIL